MGVWSRWGLVLLALLFLIAIDDVSAGDCNQGFDTCSDNGDCGPYFSSNCDNSCGAWSQCTGLGFGSRCCNGLVCEPTYECSSCGGSGEPVCSSGSQCQSGLVAVAGTCQSCGGNGQPACSTYPPCQSGLEPDGSNICQPCGGATEPACGNSPPNPGGSCSVGSGYGDACGWCWYSGGSCGEPGDAACTYSWNGVSCFNQCNDAIFPGICNDGGTCVANGDACSDGKVCSNGACVCNGCTDDDGACIPFETLDPTPQNADQACRRCISKPWPQNYQWIGEDSNEACSAGWSQSGICCGGTCVSNKQPEDVTNCGWCGVSCNTNNGQICGTAGAPPDRAVCQHCLDPGCWSFPAKSDGTCSYGNVPCPDGRCWGSCSTAAGVEGKQPFPDDQIPQAAWYSASLPSPPQPSTDYTWGNAAVATGCFPGYIFRENNINIGSFGDNLCHQCGNGVCSPGEHYWNCWQDCPSNNPCPAGYSACGSSCQPTVQGQYCEDYQFCTVGNTYADACGTTCGTPRSCNTPPAATCASANVRRTYSPAGTCNEANDACDYSFTDTACPANQVCGGGSCACPSGSTWNGATCVETACADGQDNDANGRRDFDGWSSGLAGAYYQGDANCPVYVSSVSISGGTSANTVRSGSAFTLSCATSQANIRSVNPTFSQGSCIFTSWSGATAQFSCTASSVASQTSATIGCSIDTAISTLTTGQPNPRTITITVNPPTGTCNVPQASCGPPNTAECSWQNQCSGALSSGQATACYAANPGPAYQCRSGQCGATCDSTTQCYGGTGNCDATTCGCVCNAGTPTVCGGTCVNTQTNTNNCGSCGNVCPGNQVCTTGSCGCPAGSAWSGSACETCDADGDGFSASSKSYCPNAQDCNDNNPNIKPGVAEICNDGADNNCNGEADYDGFTGGLISPAIKGDSACPVSVTAATAPTPMCVGAQGSLVGNCTYNVVSRSGTATLGANTCTFLSWSGLTASYNCSTAGLAVGSNSFTCGINTSRSYQSGTNQAAATTLNGPGNACAGNGACLATGVCQSCNVDGDAYNNKTLAGCVAPATDCNDFNNSVYPGAALICGNGVAEDCGTCDPHCSMTWNGRLLDMYGQGIRGTVRFDNGPLFQTAGDGSFSVPAVGTGYRNLSGNATGFDPVTLTGISFACNNPTVQDIILPEAQCKSDCSYQGVCRYDLCTGTNGCNLNGFNATERQVIAGNCSYADVGAWREINSTHSIACCTGGPTNVRPTASLKTQLSIQGCSRNTYSLDRIVNYNGTILIATFMTTDECE